MGAAAVAAIARPTSGGELEVLLVRRPERPGDRWSGNLAFPGGLARGGEARDLAATARREAAEEVGLELGEALGTLSELITAAPGRARPMKLRPYVFAYPARGVVEPDPREVAEAFWVDLRELADLPRTRRPKRVGPIPLRAPGLELRGGELFLWGLTYAMVRELLQVWRGR